MISGKGVCEVLDKRGLAILAGQNLEIYLGS